MMQTADLGSGVAGGNAPHEATAETLEPVAADLGGRSLVTLNSGSPSGARRMAHWALERGARYLDGAIKNVPSAAGAEDTLLYYSGSRAVFDEFESTLQVLGGDTVFLGADANLAALYEMAFGSAPLPALVGFLHGGAAMQSRGLTATSMVRFADFTYSAPCPGWSGVHMTGTH